MFRTGERARMQVNGYALGLIMNMVSTADSPLRVAIATLGCKVNQYESASFLSTFVARGVKIVPFSQQADIYVVNTCAVTNKAGAQSRQTIRRAMKQNPAARLVVTGCYSQVAAAEILALAANPLCVVGNGYKHLLVDFALAPEACDLEMFMTDIGQVREICPLPVDHFASRTRAYVKIQDGCNSFCSYCIVPLSRGRSRSVPPEIALGQIRMFALAGYQEIVVTGINVGRYGQDLRQDISLAEFLEQAAALHPAVRLRLSSLEPTELNERMLDVFRQNGNLLPHFHIPLQSGDSGVLARMNRRYDAALFAQAITRAHEALPQAAIGVDIMVGFPGESAAAFANSYDLLARLPITYLHVFPYSKRPGTLAAKMKAQVPGKVKKERVQRLLALSKQKKSQFYQGFIGETMQVLAENKQKKKGLMRGFSENYIPIFFAAPAAVKNKVVAVRIEAVEGEEAFGVLAD